jgi:adenylate cyclase
MCPGGYGGGGESTVSTTPWIRDLARRTGETPDRLACWLEQGLLDGTPERHDSAPAAGEIERVRLLQGLLRRGLPEPEAIQAVRDHGRTVDRYVERWLDTRERTHSMKEVADQTGIDPKLASELLASAGLGTNDRLTGADLEAISRLQMALDAGLTPDAMTQLLRVYGDAVQRIAEAEIRLFQVHVYERLRSEGLADDELSDRSQSAGGTLRSLVEPTLLYFHRRARSAAWPSTMAEDSSDAGRELTALRHLSPFGDRVQGR